MGRAPELAGTLEGLGGMARMLPYLRDLDLASLDMEGLGARFSDPFLRAVIAHAMFDESFPTVALVMTLAPTSRRIAGYPLGGSLEFARDIERRFTDLGGRVVYRSRVSRVLERGGRAVGAQLADGGEVSADWVISASDMRATLFDLLDGTRVHPLHQQLLTSGTLYEPAIRVFFGVSHDLSDEVSCMGTVYELDQPVEIAGRRQTHLVMHNHCYDPALAPQGKSVVSTFMQADWSYRERLPRDSAAYREEKDRIAAVCLEQIERRCPGMAS